MRVEERDMLGLTDGPFIVAGLFQAPDQRRPEIDVAGIDLDAPLEDLCRLFMCPDFGREVRESIGRFRITGLPGQDCARNFLCLRKP